MADDTRKDHDKELDSFWDLSSIIPPKKKCQQMPKYASHTERLADIVSEPRSDAEGATEDAPIPKKSTVITHYVNPKTEAEEKNKPNPELEYSMETSLIHKVEIYTWRNNYNYYDAFDRLAHKYYTFSPVSTPDNVQFFSYVPHYSHMSRHQFDWYIYWRSRVRGGEYMMTGYSYILLYIYELLALSDVIPADEIQRQLCGIWINYRGEYPQLDRFMSDYICDLSLIHRLPPPILPNEVFESLMRNCTLKEYYIPCYGKDYSLYADVVAKYCSSYDYKKSKFYKDDNIAVYDKHIVGALEYVMSRYSESGRIFSVIGLTDSHLTKDAFVGAVCTSKVKKRIEVDFCSFSRTNDLRYTVGSITKHCENRIRAYLGIKSRFGAVGLHPGIRACIDEYFDANLKGTGKAPPKEEVIPEYERRYDVPKEPFSIEKAKSIEESSWETTGMLIEAFGDGTENTEAADTEDAWLSESGDTFETASETQRMFEGISIEALRFLKICLESDGDTLEEKNYASRTGKLCDMLAEEVNNYALERIEDILLEDNGSGGYSVIDDYVEEAREIILHGDTDTV